eukprot:8792355-Alexandrium_andersonii.AAC.1
MGGAGSTPAGTSHGCTTSLRLGRHWGRASPPQPRSPLGSRARRRLVQTQCPAGGLWESPSGPGLRACSWSPGSRSFLRRRRRPPIGLVVDLSEALAHAPLVVPGPARPAAFTV